MDEADKGLCNFVNDATDLGGETVRPGSASGTTNKLSKISWILFTVAHHTITFVVQTIPGLLFCNRSRVDGDKRTQAHGTAKISPGCVGRCDRSTAQLFHVDWGAAEAPRIEHMVALRSLRYGDL